MKITKNWFVAILLSTVALSAGESGFYLGAGYASTKLGLDADIRDIKETLIDKTTDSFLLTAGYDFNENLAIEGRYYINGSEAAYEYNLGNTPLSGSYKAESIALYAKPQYRILPMLGIYALLGVTYNDYSINSLLGGDESEALFSWGAGVRFDITSDLGVYVDYTDFGESDNLMTTTDLSSWNIGFSYKF